MWHARYLPDRVIESRKGAPIVTLKNSTAARQKAQMASVSSRDELPRRARVGRA